MQLRSLKLTMHLYELLYTSMQPTHGDYARTHMHVTSTFSWKLKFLCVMVGGHISPSSIHPSSIIYHLSIYYPLSIIHQSIIHHPSSISPFPLICVLLDIQITVVHLNQCGNVLSETQVCCVKLQINMWISALWHWIKQRFYFIFKQKSPFFSKMSTY